MRALKNGEAIGGKDRDRIVTAPPVMTPFHSFGDTWRGPYHLVRRGWYFVEPKGFLHGPFASKTAAATICLRVDVALRNEKRQSHERA